MFWMTLIMRIPAGRYSHFGFTNETVFRDTCEHHPTYNDSPFRENKTF